MNYLGLDISHYAITYIIPLADDSLYNTSPLQGFSAGLLRTTDTIEKILQLPPNVLEFASSYDDIARFRMTGASFFHIVPIDKSHLHLAPQFTPFQCIFSDDATFDEAVQYVNRCRLPVAHFSKKESLQAISFAELSSEHIVRHCNAVLDYLRAQKHDSCRDLPLDFHLQLHNTAKKPLPFDKRNHLCTVPNELVLLSLGYVFPGERILIDSSQATYIEAMLESAHVIRAEREKVLPAGISSFNGTSLILFAPSLYRHMYRKRLRRSRSADYGATSALRMAFGALRRQTDFSLALNGEDGMKIMASTSARNLLLLRAKELRAHTAGVAIRACDCISPVLRLPPGINALHGDLESLGQCARGASPHRLFKMNKIQQRIRKRLFELLPKGYADFLSSLNGEVKLVADAPVEWTPIGRLPLMFRADVSRIPSTPGNLSFQLLSSSCQRLVTMKDLDEVLIIRSFSPTDPARNILQEILEKVVMGEEGNEKHVIASARQIDGTLETATSPPRSINLRWIDVGSEDEFVAALDGFRGSLMIYDGHGSHSPSTEIGSLRIGNRDLDVWTLRGKVRIPPIVLLSACDTHPIDASHSSTANGFLAAGAVSVLATTIPINAWRVAVFIGKLILKLKCYPLGRGGITWTQFVGNVLRRMLVYEILQTLSTRATPEFSSAAVLRILSETGEMIDPLQDGWYENSIEIFARELGRSTAYVFDLIDRWGQSVECMSYVQMGNPDLIIVMDELPEAR